MDSCAICPRPCATGAHACATCVRQITEWLTELPRQLRHLRHALIPEGRPAQGRTSGSATAPLPVNLAVLNLLGPGWPLPPADPYGDTTGPVPITPLLAGWAGYIAYQHQAVWRTEHGTEHNGPCDGAHPSRGATVPGWCHWLTAYLPYAAEHTWIRDLHRQLDTLMARVYDLTHAVPHRHRQAAPCPNCRGYALVQVDGQFGISCDACGHHLDPEQYTAHAQALISTQQPTGDTMATTDKPETVARRAAVQRLAQQDPRRSARSIAAELGISKDTARRDLAHLAHTGAQREADDVRQQPAAPKTPATLADAPGPPSQAVRDALAGQTARAHAAMRQLAEAVTEVEAARVPYALITDQVAHDWAAQLRQASETLVYVRQQFADYHPKALIAGATVSHRRTTDAPPAPVAHPAPTPIREADPGPPPLRLRRQTPPDEAA